MTEKIRRDILNEKRDLTAPLSDTEAKKMMSKHSRRSFLIGGIAAAAGFFGYSWLRKPDNFYIFQKGFRFNESVSQTFFGKNDLAPEFSREKAGARSNGDLGLGEDFDVADWDLQVVGVANANRIIRSISPDISFGGEDNAPRSMDTPPAPNVPVAGLLLSLDDIKSVAANRDDDRIEMYRRLESGRQLDGRAILRFRRQICAAGEIRSMSRFVTPDRAYYVGWDMPSIMHPQTLLAYEMNGAPLEPIHGAPLAPW